MSTIPHKQRIEPQIYGATKKHQLQDGSWAIFDKGFILPKDMVLTKTGHGYALLGGKYAHRLVMGEPKGMQIDHINGNGLDNRKCNLRICTRAENRRNTKLLRTNKSGYIGVHFNKRQKRWIAQIQLNRKTKHLGSFTSAREAAIHRDSVARVMFGEYARLNFM